MQIALETNGIYTARAGVARYIRGVMEGFAELGDKATTVTPIAWAVENLAFRQPTRALRTFFREVVWANVIAPRLVRRAAADVFHLTGMHVASPAGMPRVMTLHDLAALRFPGRFRPWHRAAARRYYRLVSEVDRIVCVSRFTADEAMRLLGVKAAKLEVIHNGVSALRPDAAAGLPELPGKFFLFVGSLEPGKRLDLLRDVYLLASARGVALPGLAIVGVRWAGVDREGVPPAGWHYLGYQPDGVLARLYEKAEALLFPSMYEGFGLPVAEAMHHGCPVICSPVASLPEVGGDAVLYAEQAPEDYLARMTQLLASPELRAQLSAAGRHRSTGFSWSRCAADLLAVYRVVRS